MRHRLCDEHTVERIAVRAGQRPGPCAVCYGHRQFLEFLLSDSAGYVDRKFLAVREFADTCLVAISHADAALT